MSNKRFIPILLIIAALLSFSETSVYADAIGASPVVVGGIFILGVAIVLAVIGLIVWLIIRSVRKKN